MVILSRLLYDNYKQNNDDENSFYRNSLFSVQITKTSSYLRKKQEVKFKGNK